MLPPIAIPYHPSHGRNRDRYGHRGEECLLCARPIDLDKKTTKAILLDDSLGQIVAPVEDMEGTGGVFFIGPDCWKAHPELHPYKVER